MFSVVSLGEISEEPILYPSGNQEQQMVVSVLLAYGAAANVFYSWSIICLVWQGLTKMLWQSYACKLLLTFW